MGCHLLTSVLLLLAVYSAVAINPADIAKFNVNGETTYCKIAPAGLPQSPYDGLIPTSAGSCPVTIKLSIALESFTMTSSVLNISWTTSANLNRSTANFPVKLNNGKVPVLLTSVYACKLNTTCERDNVVFPVASIGRVTTQFDLQRPVAVPLKTYRMEIPSSGDYVVVGEIVIDAGVSTDKGVSKIVSSIAFQRVRASIDGLGLPATVRPSVAGVITSGLDATSTPTSSPSRVAKQITAVAEDSVMETRKGNDTNLESTPDSSSAHRVVLIVLVVCVGFAIALIVVVYACKPNRSTFSESVASAEFSASSLRVESPVPAFHNRPQGMTSHPMPTSIDSIGNSGRQLDSFLGREEAVSSNDSYQSKSELSNGSRNKSLMQSKISFGDSFESIGSDGLKPSERASKDTNSLFESWV